MISMIEAVPAIVANGTALWAAPDKPDKSERAGAMFMAACLGLSFPVTDSDRRNPKSAR
jgi:hypothetical protein